MDEVISNTVENCPESDTGSATVFDGSAPPMRTRSIRAPMGFLISDEIDPTGFIDVCFSHSTHFDAWIDAVDKSDKDISVDALLSELLLAACNPARDRCNRIIKTYFMQFGSGGPIKIGHTGDLRNRFKGHQVSSPVNLNYMGDIDGDHEALLHWHFRYANVRGEWYWPTDNLLSLIVKINVAITDAAEVASRRAVPARRSRRSPSSAPAAGRGI